MSFWLSYRNRLLGALDQVEVLGQGDDVLSIDEGLDLACSLVDDVAKQGSEIFFIGNGASAAFASHMAADWTKHGRIPSRCFTDLSLLTATANDFSFEEVFERSLRTFVRPGSLLVTISSSGGSPNIIRAAQAARELEIPIIGFSGFSPDNASRSLSDLSFYVPDDSYGTVECIHQVLLHAWLDCFVEKHPR